MNNKIKEILEHLKYKCLGPKELELKDCKVLLDYITNLQQENERLETNCGELQNAIDNIAELVDVPEGMSVEDVYDKVKDYKSRCEKAIEYIEKYLQEHVIDDLPDEESKFETEDGIPIPNAKEILLNILQNGGDKNV